jgi:hypothetical protein
LVVERKEGTFGYRIADLIMELEWPRHCPIARERNEQSENSEEKERKEKEITG